MKNYFKPILLIIFIAILVGIVLNLQLKIFKKSIEGCYVAHLAKDVFILDIVSDKDNVIKGNLDIKNYEKDGSTGPIKGTYKDDILLADYTFLSEGTTSFGQVVFKRIGSDFVRGYGETNADDKFFADLHNVSFDTSVVYKYVGDNCQSN